MNGGGDGWWEELETERTPENRRDINFTISRSYGEGAQIGGKLTFISSKLSMGE